MINWGLLIGLTVFSLMITGIAEVANAIYNINHKEKDDE